MTKGVQTSAQQQPRKTGPEEQRLNVFVGKWRTEGETTGGEGPVIPLRSSDEYEWLPGNFFVFHRWDGTAGETEVHGIEIMGYDANSGAYRTQFFDNDGNSGSEQLSVRDRTWTWVGRRVMGSDWHRCTAVVSDDGNSIRATHERSNDGTSWMPWMDVTLRRVR